ncbi:MAG TPA: DUF4432 family protein [Bryobacteraceae bacterium]|nr:DUF4432 family protein [Bryobacteraceae bacterium]
MACRVSDNERVAGFRAVRMENELLSMLVLPERGAEVHSLTYRPRNMDVLWKAPWDLRAWRGNDTEALWMDGYSGGWQELFPNAGDACVYKGALLGFHGEASISCWECRVEHEGPVAAAVEFSARLARSPFALRRRYIVEVGRPSVRVEEEITNRGEEDLHFMWGHHPAYGAPFLSGECRLIAPAAEWLQHGKRAESWPGELRIPGEHERHASQSYLTKLLEGRYVLYSQRHGFGVRWTWPVDVFPYVHLWQELRGSFGYPWYGRCYVIGVEPFTSMPGVGLNAAIEFGTAPVLRAGDSIAVEFTVGFVDRP